MSLPTTLQKLRMYREWLEYVKDQDIGNSADYDERWEDFLYEWRTEKALNMLAESYSSEDDFDEASWGEGFVEEVYSGDADDSLDTITLPWKVMVITNLLMTMERLKSL